MTALPFVLEKQVALSAVTRACHLTASLFSSLRSDGSDTLTKSDTSPVTIGDFSAQAVINTILQNAFPDDPIIGEEDSKDLRSDAIMRGKIEVLANKALATPPSGEEKPAWGIGGAPKTAEELLDTIDRGTYAGSATGRQWCLDPIDGTKGFLRGGQYAVCLALVVDSVVQVGVIGCPNLPFEDLSGKVTPGSGSIFLAVRGQGAEKIRFPSQSAASPTKLSIPATPNPPFRLLESVESGHADHTFQSLVSSSLNISVPSLRMDSQAKYCAVANSSSGGDVYLRLPVPGKKYIEKIWDHAAGSVIIEEAGGVISDSLGRPLKFGLGRTLGENFGVVACARGSAHSKVIEAIATARAEEKRMQGEAETKAFEEKVGAT